MSTFVGGNVTNNDTNKKHETTRRRTTHVIIIITLPLPLDSSFFSDALLLCAVRLFFSKAAFVLHQRATTLLRVVFLVSRVDLSEDIERTTQNCTTQLISNSSSFIVKRLKVCFQKNDKNVSLSLCSFFCFKKKLFRRQGKRTIKERNSSRVTCSNENVNAKKKP